MSIRLFDYHQSANLLYLIFDIYELYLKVSNCFGVHWDRLESY